MIHSSMIGGMDADAFWSRMKTMVVEVLQDQMSTSPPGNGSSTKPLLKVKEVCALLSISRPTLYQWMHIGRLCSVKIGARRYFHREQVEKLLHPFSQVKTGAEGFSRHVETFLISTGKGIGKGA